MKIKNKSKNKKNKKETVIKVAKVVLKIIGAAGFVSMAVMAPNALQALDMFTGRKKKYRAYYIKNTIYRLKDRGIVEFKKRGGKTFLRLTEKGQRELLKYQLREKVIEKPKRWDKKWRVVIFDIKEQLRNLRKGLRQELINLGFIRLQNSVWVYPYECEEVVAMIKTYFAIGKDVLYMTVDKIENDRWLKEEFNLT